jgi:Putative glycosyl/glycerophosphate transferases involved in teichoic acid biosynthesis TagF/TagB/EpsJ/RodC
MNIEGKLYIYVIGVLARILNIVVPVKKNHWIFGSAKGLSYREGTKYLLEYMLKKHPEYHCVFITINKDVAKELREKGVPCYLNASLKGMWAVLRGDKVFFSQSVSDIRYVYKKKNRKFYYIVHGMPFKKAASQLPKEYKTKFVSKKKTIIGELKGYLMSGFNTGDTEFLSACSSFLAHYLQIEYPNVPVKILGMPRNDALFQQERMKDEKWLPSLDGKFVITYMPTHRKYGNGEVSPSPFISRQDIQEWMKINDVVLLVKNHPNMIPKLTDVKDTEVIKDITKQRLDPQVCIYHSDVLITDYSSVWMDYLLLRRPLIFYTYDDFSTNDVGSYYDLRDDFPNNFCSTEDELFEMIKNVKTKYDEMRPSEDIINRYHKYIDGHSCERYFDAIVNTK